MIARALVATLALALAAVLASDLRDTRTVARAVAEAGQPDRLDAALATLRERAEATGDTAPLLSETEILLAARRYDPALAAALRAARREPEHARAWLLVGLAAGGAGDAAAERDARRAINALVARP